MELKSAFLAPSATNPAGTAGVDMAANPLSLGVRKLRASVNMRHEEGTLKTRFGFRYHRLGVSGQFQGGFHYSPSKGLSSRPFAPKNSALVIAVKGRLFLLEATGGDLSCGVRELCGDYDFACKGAVHLYQAENWLIVQNPLGGTWFWEGFNCLTRSPGMAGDLTDNDPALPVPVLPRRGRCWTTNTFLRILVVDDITGLPIPGASVVLKVGERQDYGANTASDGDVTFYPVPKTYTYQASKTGYDSSTPTTLVIRPNDTRFIEVRLVTTVFEAPAVLMLVLDQTGSIGVGGAQRGIEIIDNTNVQAMGYVSFGDTVVQSRAVTEDLAAVRAELAYAVANPDLPPFFGDGGGDLPENGVDAIAQGLALLAAFTAIPDGDRAMFFKTDTAGHKYEVAVPAIVNANLNLIDFAWLEFGDSEFVDGSETGLYETTFPETARVSHTTFPLLL